MSKSENGFTLIEMLTALAIVSVMLTLGAAAFRTYWLRHSLDGAADEVASSLRGLQQRVVSESHPLVYGFRFTHGDNHFDTVQFEPGAAVGEQCSLVGRVQLSGGVSTGRIEIRDPAFSEVAPFEACTTEVGPGGYVFFFSRGTANAGSVRVYQPNLDESETVSVSGLTGRVTRS